MPEYPHLGWNPAPGSPPAIAALRTKLMTSATALGTAHRLVTQLLGESTYWRGEAADAFREALDGDLPRQLRNAHRSVSKAAAKLRGWHDDLVGYQATARRYDTRAKLDAAALMRAESHHERARTTNVPEPELKAAGDAVTRAREALESVRRLARELEETHRVEAGRVAKSLNEATERLAPGEPGVLDRVLKWVDDNLGDTLSLLSASLGLLAIFAAGPIAVPLLFAAAGLSLAAAVSHLSDPKHRLALKAGITDGRLDGQFWSSAVTVGGDILGALPGVGPIAEGAKALTAATRTATAAEHSVSATLSSSARAFGAESAAAMREADDAPKPVLDWVVRRTSPRVDKPLQAGVAASGVLTTGVGLTPTGDADGVQATATGVDGARMAASDAPSVGVSAARTWAQLNR